MNAPILDVLTDAALRSDKELKKHLVNKSASGTPWLIAQIPE